MKHVLLKKTVTVFVLFTLLLGWSVPARGQGVRDFEVKNPCLANPSCKDDATQFSDTHPSAEAWRWSFGDPAGGSSTERNPSYVYANPGSYTVTLERTLKGGKVENVRKVIQVGELPPAFQNWFTDTTICDKITLDPYPQGGPSGAKYIWYPKGDTTQTLTVDSTGCYSVEVIMPNGCKIQDKVHVKICLEPEGQEGAKWYFGGKAGLDFGGGNPVANLEGKLDTKEGTSVMSNAAGKLLFYSDGITIYNADHEKMPCLSGNCEDLKGSPESTQSVLIVPQPTCKGCEYLYNVFTTTSIKDKDKLLTVSVVDMRQNKGKGAIVEQNRILGDNTTERLVSSRNDKDTTYWTISHDAGSNRFRIFHATTGGLTETASPQLGLTHTSDNQGEGQMKFSSADSTGQRQLAVVVPGPTTNYVEIFGFNDETGVLTGPSRTLNLGEAPPKAYGVEFSPDGSKLYVSFTGGENGAYSKLRQYDLNLNDNDLIAASAFTIDSSRTEKYGALQIAPNGKIYMAVDGSEYLAVIGEPDDSTRTLGRLEYEREGVSLGGRKSGLGLPNFVQNFTNESSGPGMDAEGFCVNEPTNFMASPLCDPIKDTYTWNFGDGYSGSGQQLSHTYSKPGKYIVTLNARNDCKDTTFTKEIEIYDVPEDLDLSRYNVDTCARQLVLESNVIAKNYVWVNLETKRIVSRDRSYTVLASSSYRDFALYVWNDPDGLCVVGDTVNLSLRRPPNFTLGPDTTMCLDSSIVIRAPGLSWKEFKWNTGEIGRELVVKQPGTYWVEVKDGNNCYNGDTITIAERPKPDVMATLVHPTGCETKDGRITIDKISPGDFKDYTYSLTAVDGTLLGSSPIASFRDLPEGAYTLTVGGHPDACTANITYNLRAKNDLDLRAKITNATCTDPRSGRIDLEVLGGKPVTYQWWDSAGREIGQADSLVNLAPGTYSMRAKDAGGCSFSLTALVVGLDQNNLADLGPDLGKCLGDSIELEPLAVDFEANNYLWSTGETTRSIFVKEDGVYRLTIWNSDNGCKGEDEIVVKSAPEPIASLPAEYGLCMRGTEPDSVLLNPTGRNDYIYYWPHSQDSTRQVKVGELGTYTVIVTNREGCSVERSTVVRDKCEPRLVVPEAFSPNGDGRNEVLDLIGIYLTDLDFKIYNRWGEVIFATESLENKWDATYRGLKVQPGVYAWVATYKSADYPERPRYKVRGSVTVIR